MTDFSLIDALGYLAAAAVFATHSMKTMIPLRVVGILSNCLFIIYGYFGGALPILVLHCVLLPMNAWRLHQMVALIKKVQLAATSDLSISWLKPFMSSRHCPSGETVFRAGEAATQMYYVVSGKFSLVEPRLTIEQGALIGEIGLVSPNNLRTFTFRCESAGDLLVMDYQKVRELYFQNPEFGFYLIRLITERLISNMVQSKDEAANVIRSSFGPLELQGTLARTGRVHQSVD